MDVLLGQGLLFLKILTAPGLFGIHLLTVLDGHLILFSFI